jgi:hypothetical protein
LEALDLYGRDWQRVTAHVGTRPATHIKSHAQKHFIMLAKRGVAVPPKVGESGWGHTIDGRRLDLNSSAARSYLSNDDSEGMQRRLEALYDRLERETDERSRHARSDKRQF